MNVKANQRGRVSVLFWLVNYPENFKFVLPLIKVKCSAIDWANAKSVALYRFRCRWQMKEAVASATNIKGGF